MPELMPSDIKNEVLNVLTEAEKRHGKHPVFLTSYQILDLLPDAIKKRLIDERGLGGEGSGKKTGQVVAAPSIVMKAALMLRPTVEVAYLETTTIGLFVDGKTVTPSSTRCGLFRIKPATAHAVPDTEED
jgi:hypothetical protein